ncbi:MAG: hypothetical protein OXB95_05855 [Rhodobacteraceae bacterium]|nr:hypothetical protein [Paracoccaceae bacterium]
MIDETSSLRSVPEGRDANAFAVFWMAPRKVRAAQFEADPQGGMGYAALHSPDNATGHVT